MLIESSLNVGDHEAEIRSLLVGAGDLESSPQGACDQFGGILDAVLRLLPGDKKWRYWFLDDFSCDSVNQEGNVITLQGSPCWLSGGAECDHFRIDVAIDTHPLLYSFKFTNRDSGTQVLYVGKSPDGWIVNGT